MMSSTVTKINLQAMVDNALEIKAKIKEHEAQLEAVLDEITNFINPGEALVGKLGTIEKSKQGKESFVYLNDDAKQSMKNFKESLEKAGFAKVSTGKPYLTVKVLKVV